MDNTQLAAICSAILGAGGIIGTAIRFAAGRLIRALDENAKAMLAQATSSATQAEAFRGQAETLRDVAVQVKHVADWCDSHTGVHELPRGIREKPQRASTPARGIGEYYVRGRTHPEDED